MARSITVHRLVGLFVPIKRCPRCGSHKIDRLPAGKPGQRALTFLGLHLSSCHDCLLRMYSWRSSRNHKRLL